MKKVKVKRVGDLKKPLLIEGTEAGSPSGKMKNIKVKRVGDPEKPLLIGRPETGS